MRKLDIKDKKILYQLDTNSRQSFQEIAKKVGLSKDSIGYRIKNLEKSGIIKQYHTIVDVGKLGYISYRLYLKIQNATPEKEQEIILFLKDQPEVGWIVSIDGEYDIGLWILTKTVKEMNSFWKKLLEGYGNYLALRQLTTFTRVAYFPRAYFLDKPLNDTEQVFVTEPDEKKIDDKDLDLLKLLAPNARKPTIEIAKELGVTAKTAAMRIRDLEKRKIIIGYRTVFDLEKLGFQYFKVHFQLHNSTKEKILQLRQFIKQHPNIIYDNEVLGGDDIEIEIQVKTLSELRRIIQLVKVDYADIIKDDKHLLFYKEHKFIFLPGLVADSVTI